ncbi:DUF6477 family protein [Cognatishimia activa]|uniref:Uncharacterized protein n=1 Tax=Cognatishimia activa TaxID=1715691 RepID=A0A0P1IP55_9RHOB|nr:DUF6477 family protein [Cognatishimia activa]CUJ24577.1 hypothetical protein TA5113_02776 [Cognatishimia activa]CUK25357.1 hypothetical protein TA5114_01155 [Cognatishimia activa]
MQDIMNRVARLNRPRLLVRTAKAAAMDYKRERHLARLLPGKNVARHSEAILLLLELERDFDDRRRANGAGYSLADHLDVMIALVAEVRLFRSSQQERVALIPERPA